MRKFKLIKKYPNSPELGYIIEILPGTNMYFYNGSQICYSDEYPEFWEEIKEPILTTEDGYEIFEGDKVYFVEIGEYLHKGCEIVNSYKNNYILDKDFKFFKTKENAEKYIYENKPEFSRKQILDALEYAKYTEGLWVLTLKIKEKLQL